jgi:hypothetical protein
MIAWRGITLVKLAINPAAHPHTLLTYIIDNLTGLTLEASTRDTYAEVVRYYAARGLDMAEILTQEIGPDTRYIAYVD